MRPKNIKELFAVLRREFGRRDGKVAVQRPVSPAQRPAPPRSGFSALRVLILAAVATRLMGAESRDVNHGYISRGTHQGQVQRASKSDLEPIARPGRPMPPDVVDQVRTLLREHPDQRERIIEELRWKGWEVDEFIN
jgi:hypothetical protein